MRHLIYACFTYLLLGCIEAVNGLPRPRIDARGGKLDMAIQLHLSLLTLPTLLLIPLFARTAPQDTDYPGFVPEVTSVIGSLWGDATSNLLGASGFCLMQLVVRCRSKPN